MAIRSDIDEIIYQANHYSPPDDNILVPVDPIPHGELPDYSKDEFWLYIQLPKTKYDCRVLKMCLTNQDKCDELQTQRASDGRKYVRMGKYRYTKREFDRLRRAGLLEYAKYECLAHGDEISIYKKVEEVTGKSNAYIVKVASKERSGNGP